MTFAQPYPPSPPQRQATSQPASSLSLRWRVMLLAMSMVAMVVVLMSIALYAVVSRALYNDIDNQLHSRARLLIESGSLAADPGRAIEGTAYSDVNAMLVNPGRSIYTANQQGEALPLGEPERQVLSGELVMSLRSSAIGRPLQVGRAATKRAAARNSSRVPPTAGGGSSPANTALPAMPSTGISVARLGSSACHSSISAPAAIHRKGADTAALRKP